MDTIKFKFMDEEIECKLLVDSYLNGNLAILLMSKDENGDYDIWCDLTTNIPAYDKLDKTEAYVNTKELTDLIGIIKKYKLAKSTDIRVSSGFNIYELFEFDMDEVNKYKLEKGSE